MAVQSHSHATRRSGEGGARGVGAPGLWGRGIRRHSDAKPSPCHPPDPYDPTMARVYLDTSFVSVCVTTRGDAASVYRREKSLGWLGAQAKHHTIFASAGGGRGLSDPDYPTREQALKLLATIPFVEIDEQVAGLATIFVREFLMPGPAAGDALHVARACVHRAEYLLSWNVTHLANTNKTRHLQVICVRAGYVAPQIVTPDLSGMLAHDARNAPLRLGPFRPCARCRSSASSRRAVRERHARMVEEARRLQKGRVLIPARRPWAAAGERGVSGGTATGGGWAGSPSRTVCVFYRR